MGFYQASWLILMAPLFSFVVIVFGTRMWDLATRRRVNVTASPEAQAEAEETSEVHMMEAHGPHGEEETLEDDEDPKVPRLTTGARVSAYTGIVITALACIYSWLLLL